MNGRLRFSLIGRTKAVEYKVSCGTRVLHAARRDEMQSDIRLWGWRFSLSLSFSLSRRLKGSGAGEEEASRGIREPEGDASAVHCSRYHVAVPANYEAALAVGSSSMNRADTLDMP